MTEKTKDREGLLSILLVAAETVVIDPASLRAALSCLMREASARPFNAPRPDPGTAPLLLSLAGTTFAVFSVQARVPVDDIAAAAAEWWPSARQDADRHRSQIVLAAMTALPAMMCEILPGAIGALWAASTRWTVSAHLVSVEVRDVPRKARVTSTAYGWPDRANSVDFWGRGGHCRWRDVALNNRLRRAGSGPGLIRPDDPAVTG